MTKPHTKKRRPPQRELPLPELLQRALTYYADEVSPLYSYLDLNEAPPNTRKTQEADRLVAAIRDAGSNSLLTALGSDPRTYEEIAIDVARKFGAKPKEGTFASETEALILQHLFSDMLDGMTVEQRREVLSSLDLDGDVDPGALAKGGALLAQVVLKQLGGFAVYQTSVVVANYLARVLLGRGLTLAANAAVTRLVGLAIGPIGWAVTAAWLAFDLAGPAYRKTLPTVVHIAYLRSLVIEQVNIGVVGDGSVGKDALLRAVLGIETANVSPEAGATATVEVRPVPGVPTATVMNFPGFNDYRPEVDKATDQYLVNADLFLLVVDVTRGLSDVDLQIITKVKSMQRPWLLCVNKLDLLRLHDVEKMLSTIEERTGLPRQHFVQCSFDPHPGLGASRLGVAKVQAWIIEQLEKRGKDVSALTGALPKSAG